MRYTNIKALNYSFGDILRAYAPESIRNLGIASASFHNLSLYLGFTLLVSGQVIRTIAMAKAGSNFNHTVQMKKKQGHVLVTDGIYAWLRHPSYFGFFWWGLGTQIVLNNTVCFAGYLIVLWRFFNHRIRGKLHLDIFQLFQYISDSAVEEEILLVKFFGDDYVKYRKRTGTGLPFIR